MSSRRASLTQPRPSLRPSHSAISGNSPPGPVAGSSVEPPTPSSRLSRSSGSRRNPTSPSGTHAPSLYPSRRPATSVPYSSPQLPSHPQRQRLSIRPPVSSVASTDRFQSVASIHGNQENPPQESADALHEIIMSIELKDNGALGCAYYITMDETLYLLEDVAMAGVDLVETLIFHINPTTVLISARASDHLANFLASNVQGLRDNQDEVTGAYVLRSLNSADFKYEAAKEKLLSLEIRITGPNTLQYMSVTDNVLDREFSLDSPSSSRLSRCMRLGTLVNLDSQLTIGCAGAIISDLQRRKTMLYLPHDPDALVAFRVKAVEMFTLSNSMFVNKDTLVSLQILRSENHPNSQMQGPKATGAKESLSIFGLFRELACTPQGRTQLRRIFIRPSIDADLIRERQKTISLFNHPENTQIIANVSKLLRRVQNMRPLLLRLRKGVDTLGRKTSVTNSVWLAIEKFAGFSLQIRNLLGQMSGANHLPIIRKACEAIEPSMLSHVGELINQIIDFDQSQERERTAVRQGVDADLDELKRRYDGMEDFLSHMNAQLQQDLPEWGRKYVENCIFFPQLGFLTVISQNQNTGKGNYEGEGAGDAWERMFATDGKVYYKNRWMREMDEQWGDAYCQIIDREIEIIHELAGRVLEQEDVIIAASEVLGEFDSLLALAVGSGGFGWIAPDITTENVIQIWGGRHPIQERVVPAFISNDCQLAGGPNQEHRESSSNSPPDEHLLEAPSTIIMTGPNHSGKSVYLKQVALIVYLAHIGCFVPADRARIGLTDRILTRIATRESVARNESAFAIDLRQAAFAVNFATRRSLVLIDEFGKGTDSLDGAGLLAALLDHFISLGPDRPKVLAATHFHEIFESQFLVESPELAFIHMAIRVDFEASALDDQVTYLYKATPGRSISSFGSRCAAMNGVDPAIVERAEAITLLLARNEDLEVACSRLGDEEMRKLETAEQASRKLLSEDIDLVGPHRDSGHRSSADAHHYRNMLRRVLSMD